LSGGGRWCAWWQEEPASAAESYRRRSAAECRGARHAVRLRRQRRCFSERRRVLRASAVSSVQRSFYNARQLPPQQKVTTAAENRPRRPYHYLNPFTSRRKRGGHHGLRQRSSLSSQHREVDVEGGRPCVAVQRVIRRGIVRPYRVMTIAHAP